MPDMDATVAALLGLSRRQARIALAITQGASREQAAAQVGVSAAIAKDELARVYATLRIDSATRLARCMTDATALVALIHGENGERVPHSPGGEATRFIARRDGSCVAYTDHGPADGDPVLLVHNTGTTRHAARTLVKALQDAGMRPVAIDRAGYGQSDMPAAGSDAGDDPFARAADDMLLLCDTLRLGRVRLLARGSAAVVVTFAQRAPERIERVVMLNPGVPEPFDSHRSAPLAIVKRALYRHPRAIEYVTRLLAQPSSADLTARRLRHGLASSPPDLALLDDPDEVEDYHRATRLMATGSIHGYIAEHRAYAAGWVPAPIADARHWTVACGVHDPLHDAARTLAFWRDTLPGAELLELPDAGRLLHVTHAGQVARMLAGRP
jgi:pimeloyl-ACP methyl ester carboxylesterase